MSAESRTLRSKLAPRGENRGGSCGVNDFAALFFCIHFYPRITRYEDFAKSKKRYAVAHARAYGKSQEDEVGGEGRRVVRRGRADFNTPDYIITAAKHALDQGKTKYTPASGIAELKAAVADKLLRVNHLSYAPAQIVVSNGAKHSLTNAFAALVEEGDEVIVPAPFWLTYPELIRLFGGVPVIVNTKKENGFKLTADELKAAITPRTRAVVLNNPNNPTGAVYDKAELYTLAEVLEKRTSRSLRTRFTNRSIIPAARS